MYTTSVKAELISLYVDDDNITGPWNGTKEHPYQNITSALEHTMNGDTIFVRVGTYHEHVVVNKSVSLVGEDRDSTIVDGENRPGNVISIKTNNASIHGFTIIRSGASPYDCGIYVDHSRGIDINHNIITNNYDGISLRDSFNNMFSGNTITNNYVGTSLYSSGNNMLSGNTITNNYDGISLYSSSNNVVSGNTISSNNNYGISLYISSSNNVVSGNTISSNNNYGMYLVRDSGNNIICRNNFNNTYQVWSDSQNVWDDGDEGNYWSDHTGQDLNGDGIGDTSYAIEMNNQDDHPLMGVFSEFSVTSEGKGYHVTTICNSTISGFRFEIGPETGNKIIRFNVTGKDGAVGFCRVRIPTKLMNYPYIVLVGVEEIVPTLLDVSNETYAYLYFTYIHSSRTITMISSLARRLEIDLYNLNATYHALLNNYTTFLGNYSELQKGYHELNSSYYNLLNIQALLLSNYSQLQRSFSELNSSYYDLLKIYALLLGNYSRLQESYSELNDSYQEHLLDYSKNADNIRNLLYIFAATTAIFIITTLYLSKQAHASKTHIPKPQSS